MAVSRVDHHCIDTGLHERVDAIDCIARHTHAGSHAQPPLIILTCIWIVLNLGDVAISDQTHQSACGIHHREFFNLMAEQNLRSLLEVRAVGRDEIVFRHDVLDLNLHIGLETQVAVGDDAHEVHFSVDNRNASDMIFFHKMQCVAYGLLPCDGNRIVDHAALGAFHPAHLLSLFGNRHILMYHADTTFAGHGDGQL